MSGSATDPVTGDRLDKWLFHARFCRTRQLAQAAVEAGRVRLNGARIDKPGRAVKPGDVLTLAVHFGARGGQLMAVRIVALAERRGPASEARHLYQVVE